MENLNPETLHIESKLAHGGMDRDPLTGSVTMPIYQTSTYRQTKLYANAPWRYSRTGNPTRAAVEELIAGLEGGNAGFAFASGLAAVTAVLQLFHSGDKILISENVYGGTFRVLDQVFWNFGLHYAIADTTDLSVLDSQFTPDVAAILIESPANPVLAVTDIAAACQIAKRHNALAIVDNTFMTPYLQHPVELGADIVIHSATKYLGGHSDLLAGLVVTTTEELAERVRLVQNSTGGVLGPFDSFLLIRGIRSLGVRMDRHVENAEKIARYLQQHRAVRHVYYPGLPGDPGYAIMKKQAKNGGAMISFELKETCDVAAFFSSVRLIALAESLGGAESLVCHPASMTHASVPGEIRERVGITEGLIRLSVGIEHVDDLIQDLEQALTASENAQKA